MTFYLVAFIVILTDLISKYLIKSHLNVGDSFPFLEPYIHFYH
jgi:hypothetical protein